MSAIIKQLQRKTVDTPLLQGGQHHTPPRHLHCVVRLCMPPKRASKRCKNRPRVSLFVQQPNSLTSI